MTDKFKKEICSNCKYDDCHINIETIEEKDNDTIITITKCKDYIPTISIRKKNYENRNNKIR